LKYLDYKVDSVDDREVVIKITKQNYVFYDLYIKKVHEVNLRANYGIVLFRKGDYTFTTWDYARYNAPIRTFALMGNRGAPHKAILNVPVELFPMFRLMVIEYNLYMALKEKSEQNLKNP